MRYWIGIFCLIWLMVLHPSPVKSPWSFSVKSALSKCIHLSQDVLGGMQVLAGGWLTLVGCHQLAENETVFDTPQRTFKLAAIFVAGITTLQNGINHFYQSYNNISNQSGKK